MNVISVPQMWRKDAVSGGVNHTGFEKSALETSRLSAVCSKCPFPSAICSDLGRASVWKGSRIRWKRHQGDQRPGLYPGCTACRHRSLSEPPVSSPETEATGVKPVADKGCMAVEGVAQ